MRADVSSARPATARWPLLLAALVIIFAVVSIHRESPRTLLSAHGFLHSAISQRFAASTQAPPENPFFAGEPLGYYWFFHALGAGVSNVTGLDPLHSFEVLICLSIVVMMISAGMLARSLYRSTYLGALIGLLVVAGANPQAPLLLLYRYLQNGSSVLAERPGYLWDIVHSISSYIRYGDAWGMHGPLINFFLNITARPVAHCSAVLALLAFRRALQKPSTARLLFLSLCVALTSALSVLIGVALAGTLIAALIIYRIASRTTLAPTLDSSLGDRAAFLVSAALGVGIVIAAPTFVHLIGESSGSIALAPDGVSGIFAALVVMLASCWLTLVFTMVGFRHTSDAVRAFHFVLTTAAVGLIAATALFVLPVGNQDNFFHVALILLAVTAPAAVVRSDGTPNMRSACKMALVFVPTLLLILFCYTGRPEIPLGFEGRLLVHLESDRGALYGYIRDETAADAIFVTDPASRHNAMGGNTAELPALTGRFLFTPRSGHYIASHYRDSAQRDRIARQLTAGEALSRLDDEYLSSLNRPIYWVDYGLPKEASQRPRGVDPVFEQGRVALYRWGPTRVGAEDRP